MPHMEVVKVVVIPEIQNQMAKYHKVQGLMRYINIKSMKEAHAQMDGEKASGVDDISKFKYEESLEANLNNLLNKMKKFEYYPKPVRRARIPKANGKVRELGIPSYEDKIVQKIIADILNNIYEPIFLDCSYGFRPKRNCHQALNKLCEAIYSGKVNYIVEADIKGFFDNVNQEVLLRLLKMIIKDRHFIEYVKRFLKAGVMEQGIPKPSETGTPQGGNMSPVLANIYLHYVLDQWFENNFKKETEGECYLIRYADDFIMLFEKPTDGETANIRIRQRLEIFGLELQEEKTRIFSFGLKEETKATFDFLGFNIYNYKDGGNIKLGMKIKEENIPKKYEAIKECVEQYRYLEMETLIKLVNLKLRGYYNYYGVSTNIEWLISIYQYAVKEVFMVWIERYGVPRDYNYLKYVYRMTPVLQPYKFITLYL